MPLHTRSLPCACPAGGPLPAQLPALASQEINLGANRFNGSLPEGWASASLQDLDLSSNQLTGSLPDAWGARDALPQLAQLHLPGNRLSGTVPQQWTAPGGFEAQFMLEPRPSNLRLCGEWRRAGRRLQLPGLGAGSACRPPGAAGAAWVGAKQHARARGMRQPPSLPRATALRCRPRHAAQPLAVP